MNSTLEMQVQFYYKLKALEKKYQQLPGNACLLASPQQKRQCINSIASFSQNKKFFTIQHPKVQTIKATLIKNHQRLLQSNIDYKQQQHLMSAYQTTRSTSPVVPVKTHHANKSDNYQISNLNKYSDNDCMPMTNLFGGNQNFIFKKSINNSKKVLSSPNQRRSQNESQKLDYLLFDQDISLQNENNSNQTESSLQLKRFSKSAVSNCNQFLKRYEGHNASNLANQVILKKINIGKGKSEDIQVIENKSQCYMSLQSQQVVKTQNFLIGEPQAQKEANCKNQSFDKQQQKKYKVLKQYQKNKWSPKCRQQQSSQQFKYQSKLVKEQLSLNSAFLGYRYDSQENQFIHEERGNFDNSLIEDDYNSNSIKSENESIANVSELVPFNESYNNDNEQAEIENNENNSEKEASQNQFSEQSDIQVLFLRSIYKDRPPTIFFQYHRACDNIRNDQRASQVSKSVKKNLHLTFKAPVDRPFQCVSNAFQMAGFTRTEGNHYNCFWGGIMRDHRIAKLNPYQKVNHIPGTFYIGRKDNLWKCISSFKRKFGQEYDFVPLTYLLRHDLSRFKNVKEQALKSKLWILKPVASACGRGIKVINSKSKLKMKNIKDYLIQNYITNVHLINGFKYDLRIYTLISSLDPLRVYVYNEGLVRFATQPYQPRLVKHHHNMTFNSNENDDSLNSPQLTNKLQNKFTHLTNYSINKKNKQNFLKNVDTNEDGEGSKWSISALRKKFLEIGVDFDVIWSQIKDIIVKTIIAGEAGLQSSIHSHQAIQRKSNCFELYGFDILIDEHYKPWLMEVNVSPSLSSTSPLDRKIKHNLLSDILNLIGIIPFDKQRYNLAQQQQLNASLTFNQVDIMSQSQSQSVTKHLPSNNNYANSSQYERGQSTYKMSDKRSSYMSKNINGLKDLCSENCIQRLSAEDWRVLIETDEEFYRKGNFDRVFPTKQLSLQNKYDRFFEQNRYNNTLVSKWVTSPVNFIEQIFQRNESSSI